MQTKIPAEQSTQNQSQATHKSTQPQFEDNHQEFATQLRLQSLVANNPRAIQLKSVQTMMTSRPSGKNAGQSPITINPIPVQRMEEQKEEQEPLQLTAEPLQREQTEATAAESTPQSQTVTISTAAPVQLLPDIFSRAAFADPGAYLERRFANSQINEDAGSGGIQDEPVRKLVLELARRPRREVFAARLIAAGGTGPGLAATLTNNVYDRETAQTWVVQNTLAISTLVPWALTIENVVMQEAPQGPVHTFHRDHGKVALTNEALVARDINSATERTARRNVLNGPGGLGWVRGHYGVLNKKHRFINHIHVDKDAPEDRSFEIYDADSANVGQTAEAFNIANRAGFNAGNDGRVDLAAVDVEGDAKRLSWEAYESGLPAEDD